MKRFIISIIITLFCSYLSAQKIDTVKVLMVLCDTTILRSGRTQSVDGNPVFWRIGYNVLRMIEEEVEIKVSQNSYHGMKILIDSTPIRQKVLHKEHLCYLNENKTVLSGIAVILMVKELNKKEKD